MTREEAIEILCAYGVPQDEKGFREALDIAIEALTQDSRKFTQESTQDLISRQDAIKPFCIAPDGTRIPEVDCDNFPVEFSVEFIKKHLLSLPSADRPTGWIPCSERMPDAEYGEGDSVLCCTELGLMYILYWDGGNWCVTTGEPHQWVNHKTGWHDKVIAWMPLPTPYKGGENHE